MIPLEAQQEASWQLVFIGRTFLQSSPGLREAPLLATRISENRAGIVSIISNDSMRLTIVEANSTIVASTVVGLKGALPFCATNYGKSLEVLVKNRLSLRSLILTEEGGIVEGLRTSFPRPFFPSGCAREGPLYIVYGGAVYKDSGIDPTIYAYKQDGSIAWTVNTTLPGDEAVYDLVDSGGIVYAVIMNASNGAVSLYELQNRKLVLLRHLGDYNYLSSATLQNEGVALLLSDGNNTIIFEYWPNHQSKIIKVPESYVVESIASSEGVLVASGWTPNTTTGLADGVLLALDPGEGRILAKSIVYGADDVRLPIIVPLGGGRILAAGTHGNKTLLVGFVLEYMETQTTGHPRGGYQPTPNGEGRFSWYYIFITLLAAAVIVLAVYIRARPSLRLKKGRP